jgi:hypothetical protein
LPSCKSGGALEKYAKLAQSASQDPDGALKGIIIIPTPLSILFLLVLTSPSPPANQEEPWIREAASGRNGGADDTFLKLFSQPSIRFRITRILEILTEEINECSEMANNGSV